MRWARWAGAVVLFGVALWLASRLQADFSDPSDSSHRRVIIETIVMMVLAAPLVSMLSWRGRGRRRDDS